MQIVNTSGTTVNEYSYDEWGNITSQTEGISNPFKYTGEIYDEETGLYYLRARYYDPSIGRFLNEDTYEGQIDNPLSQNLYTYVHNNPLRYVDPSGNKVWLIHGTWSNPTKAWGKDNSFDKYIEGLFNESSDRLEWSGENNTGARSDAAEVFLTQVYEWHKENPDEPIRLVGHSHGGNVAIMLANLLAEKGMKVESLITIATPVREYQLTTEIGQRIHVYNKYDAIQRLGGSIKGGLIKRTFDDAQNIEVKLPFKYRDENISGIKNHSRMHSDIKTWKKYIEPILKLK